MDDGRLDRPPTQEDTPLPGLPGQPRLHWGLFAVLALLIGADGLFWHGLLFRSRIWHICLWGLVSGGLAIGGFAYWRRNR
jgi:hypothetical protein